MTESINLFINFLATKGIAASYDEAATALLSAQSRLAQAIRDTDINPSDKEVSAGNAKKGKFSWQGFRIAIENPKGSLRGKHKRKMGAHYGYFLGADKEAMDGDKLDVFVGPNLESDKVFIIDQNKTCEWCHGSGKTAEADTGGDKEEPEEITSCGLCGGDGKSDEPDEKKVLIAFDSEADAKQAYFDSYEPGFAEKIFDDIDEMTVDQFKKWVKTADFSWRSSDV